MIGELDIQDYCMVADENLRETLDCTSITEKSRDRVEMRTAYTTADINWLFGKGKWKNLRYIGAIKTEVE